MSATPSERLERALNAHAACARGMVGVAARHVESGRRFAMNADGLFQMASTYKVPIAVCVLDLVHRGALALGRMETVQPRDFVIGGTIGDRLRPGETAFSVRLLLERMLIESDNTSTDVLLRVAGGASTVNARLRELGFARMRVDRTTAEIIGEAYDTRFPDDGAARYDYFARTQLAEGLDVPAAAAARYERDERDTTTPAEMTVLLERLHRRDPALLPPAFADLLLGIMARCSTGSGRLRALLPAGTTVAEKTGTFGGTVNDAGIVTLPDGAGHIVVSVFIRGAQAPTATCERTIAEISRTLYDYVLFT